MDPRYEEFEGRENVIPRYVPKNAANAWLTKLWGANLTTSLGVRYLGPQFNDNANMVRLGGWTTFSGAAGYQAERWSWTVNADNLFNRERYFLGGQFSNVIIPRTAHQRFHYATL